MHTPHAQFMAQSKLFNGGKEVGLLRGASTRMATWFYAMMRMMRLRAALEATIHHAHFRDVAKNDRMKRAIEDISNAAMWRAMFSLCRSVFPALLALRYCDKSTPCMDKIVTLARRTTLALEMSSAMFNDENLFPLTDDDYDLAAEEEHIFGTVVEGAEGEEDESYDSE